MNRLSRNKKGFSTVEMVLVIVVVILIGLAGWLVYKNHQKTKTNPVTTTSTSTKTVTKPNTTLVKIPKLSIEITVPNSLKDLTYTVSNQNTNPSGTSVWLSTQTLTDLDNSCGSNGNSSSIYPPLGALTNYSGQFSTSSPPEMTEFYGKQFTNFYIAYDTPQVECSTNSSVNNQATADLAAFKTALSTIQPIQ